MDLKSALRDISTLLAGRWQVPLVAVALVAIAVSVSRLRPPPREVDFDVVLADLVAVRESGNLRGAADACANFLDMDPPLPGLQRAQLHHFLSDVFYRVERLRERPLIANVEQIIEHQQAAQNLGRRPDVADLLRVARAHDWLRRADEAISVYRRVLDEAIEPEHQREAIGALVALLEGRPSADAERRALIQQQLQQDGVSPAYIWASVQDAMLEAFSQNDTIAARQVLERFADVLMRSDLRPAYDYLQAWLLVQEGRYLEADPLARAVDEWFQTAPVIDPDLMAAGFTPTLNLVLQGRILLEDHRPQAALRAFDRALELEGVGETTIAALAGRVVALAALERHATAHQAVRAGLESLSRDARIESLGRARLGDALLGVFESLVSGGRLGRAVGYMELAVGTVPATELQRRLDWTRQLATVSAQAARAATLPAERAALEELAARSFEQSADLSSEDFEREADLLWSAIEQYDRAGLLADTTRVLDRFVRGRTQDSRLPAALLRLAEIYELRGDLRRAAEAHEELIQRFSPISEAAKARLARARILILLDDGRLSDAEQSLLALLEAENIGPDASVFREALRTLGELVYDSGRWADAIRRLEDYLVLYGEQADSDRTRFLLANAYRRSAMALRESPPSDVPLSSSRSESQARLARAAELYEQIDSGSDDEHVNEISAVYRRLSLLYRGDCLAALERGGAQEAALGAYRQAAARYQQHPTALVAQVRQATIYLRQGRVIEAARAVESARWLLRHVPERSFEQFADGSSRESWERYLETLTQSILFREVLQPGERG